MVNKPQFKSPLGVSWVVEKNDCYLSHSGSILVSDMVFLLIPYVMIECMMQFGHTLILLKRGVGIFLSEKKTLSIHYVNNE